MANEFRHGTAGTSLTQAEYELITGHSFASQATGDILYASSATQLTRLGVGSNNDTLQLVGDIPAWVSNPIIADNNQLRLGTGSDSAIYYDGTDTFWDLRRAGTGDLMIALGGSFPSPDGTAVHIWAGTAGAVTAFAPSVLVVEGSSTTQVGLSILGPNTTEKLIIFGEPAGNTQGFIGYHGSTDTPANTLRIGIGGSNRLLYSAGAFAFQEATAISTTAGDLDITPAAELVINTTQTRTVISNSGAGVLVRSENLSNTGSSNAYFLARVAGTSGGSPYIRFSIVGATVPDIVWGYDNNGDTIRLAHTSILDGAQATDSIRVTSSARAITFDDSSGADFDYVCDRCGRHGLETFPCCGEVSWHDDTLALRQGMLSKAGLAHLVKLGVYEIDGSVDAPTWVGINFQQSTHMIWNSLWQNRERMDAQYDELNRRLLTIGV